MKSVQPFIQHHKQAILWYVTGFFTLGLGVNIMKAATLGNGAWDTVTINIRAWLNTNIGWTWVTLGMVSFAVSLILFMIVLLYRKQLRYVFMLIPIFLVAIFIDFWNILVFQDRVFVAFPWQLVSFIIGSFVLPLGLSMIIKSGFPAFVFDELMMMIKQLLHATRILYVRLGIELTGIAIGSLFGYWTFYKVDGTLGAVNIGSFVFTLTLPLIMTMWFRVLRITHV